MSSPTGMCLLCCAYAAYEEAAANARKLRREIGSLVAMDRNNIIIDVVGCRSSLCLVAILLLGACSARHERDLPDLPHLTIANFRPQIRDQVQKAYDDVKARPKDAESHGRLGMLLQAFSQFESAEPCYQRARILDPNRFQWAY